MHIAFPYLGKDKGRYATENLPENILMRLPNLYLNIGRNMTRDYSFLSLLLDKRQKMKKKNVVSVTRHRKEIPHEVKNSKTQQYNTVYLKNTENALTVCYI